MNRANTTRSGVITVVIAEDHQVVRHGLALLLKSDPDLKLVGEASDGLEAISQVEALDPDVLLLDLMIPQVHGLEVIRHLRANNAPARIIVLSMHKEDSVVLESLRAGASGYVLKESSSRELLEAVHKVSLGQRHLSPALSHVAADLDNVPSVTSRRDGESALTGRERMVLQLAADGLSSKEIASRLLISPRTAETHRANLMRKLCLRSQTDLVRFAIRRQIIPL